MSKKTLFVALLLVAFVVSGLLVASANSRPRPVRSVLRPVSFEPSASVAIGGQPSEPVVADLNRDGALDIATPSGDRASMVVRLGDGDGTFTPVAEEAALTTPSRTAGADFNRDGETDLVVIDWNYSSLPVLLGDGDGTFTPTDPIEAGNLPSSIGIADLNNDGKADVVVTNQSSSSVSVRLGDGDGTFTEAATETVGNSPRALGITDFNHDGKTDMAVVNLGADTVSVRLGNGDGTFTAAETQTVGAAPCSIAAGDLNGDGDADMAVVNGFGASVSVRLGNGNGTFSEAATVTAGEEPSTVHIKDVNCDGKPDLVVPETDAARGRVGVHLGYGDGTFASPVNFGVGDGPGFAAFGDFNRDGRPDVVVPNGLGDDLSVLLNSTARPTGLGYGAPTTSSLGADPVNSAVGDLNNDALPDFVANTYNPLSLMVRLNNGDGTFSVAADLPFAGDRAEDVAIADFDNDGNADVAAAIDSSQWDGTGYLLVYGGNGDGAFTQVDTQTVTPGGADYLGVGDFNRDGNADVAVARSFSVDMFLGDGDGTFTGGVSLGAGNYPYGVAVDDYNNDGKADLATAANSDRQLRVALGVGDGTFGDLNVVGSTGEAPYDVESGDFNRDGKRDLVVPNQYGDTLSVFLGDGTGAFSALPAMATGTMPVKLAVADLNNNGTDDIAVVNAGGNSISLFRGDGSGGFSLGATVTATGMTPNIVQAADVENDGSLELITGPTSPTSYLCVFRRDLTAPSTTASFSPSGPDGDNTWYKTRPQITLTSNRPGTSYYQWDATLTAGWQTYSGAFDALDDTHTLYYFSADSAENTETTQGQEFSFMIDTTAPVDPTSVSSTSHIEDSWSATPTIDIAISADATDVPSGVEGYAVSWSEDDTETPPEVMNMDVAELTASSTRPDGIWYFNLRTKDNAGNWTSTVHAGPYKIDTIAPGSPVNLTGTPGDAQIALSWANPDDPDFNKTRILRSESDFATSPTDTVGQTVAVNDTDTASATDTGLTNGTTYCYTAFSRDLAGNWSMAATATATPRFATAIAANASAVLVDYNGAVVVSGRVTVASLPIPGLTNVTVWGRPEAGGTWTELGTATYDVVSGNYQLSVRCKQNMLFEVRFGGDTLRGPSTSGQVNIHARAYLSQPWASPVYVVGRGAPLTLTGLLAPRHSGRTTLEIYRHNSTGWHLYARRYATNRAYGSVTRYTGVVRIYTRGYFCVRAYHYDASHAKTRSLKRTILVR